MRVTIWILRIVVVIGVSIFCLYHGWKAALIPSPQGRNYFPFFYSVPILLMMGGAGKGGLYFWPLATIVLLIKGHWIFGWIPLLMTLFTIIWGVLRFSIEYNENTKIKPKKINQSVTTMSVKEFSRYKRERQKNKST